MEGFLGGGFLVESVEMGGLFGVIVREVVGEVGDG